MILAHANVLIYALRGDSPHHGVCKPWLDAVIAGDRRLAARPERLAHHDEPANISGVE